MAAVTTPSFHETYGVKEAELCNRALWRIGAETIKDTSEDTKQSRVAKTVYAQTRDELLRMYPFTFAVKTVLIPEDSTFAPPKDQYSYAFKSEDRVVINPLTTVSGSKNISAITLAAPYTAADLVGRIITGTGIPENTRIVSATGTTPSISAVMDKSATASATITNAVAALSVLKILEVAGNPESIFDVVGASDGRRILCNMVSEPVGSINYLEMKYVEQVVDPDRFDSMFTDALVLRIASKIAVTLSQSAQLGMALQQEFAAIMQLAKNASAEERQIDAPDPWWTDRQETENSSAARR